MKKLITLSSILLSFQLQCQIRIGAIYNMDFYKPYTQETQDYLKINTQVFSNTGSTYATYNILKKEKINWSVGLVAKIIHQTTEQKIKAYYWPDFSDGSWEYRKEALDLRNRSVSLGVQNEISSFFTKKEVSKLFHEIGVSNEVFLFERYRSGYFYSGTKDQFSNSHVNIYPLQPGFKKFFVSSANVGLFYRLSWQSPERVRIATKISIGTNIYSDWDQFRKYAWIGLGLEVGFGGEIKQK